jgi:hypothetical protein
VLVGILLTSRERASRRGREPRTTLTFPGAPPIAILGEDQLRGALARLDAVEDGACVRLSESDTHCIEAVRRGEFWSAGLHTGSFWTSDAFATGGSHYSELEVRRRRAAGLKEASSARTRADQALTTDEVRGLFVAYLLGSRYPLGSAGGAA